VTPQQLRKGRRYAIVACAAIAAFLPGDAVTLLLETVPLYILYEASILMASFVARRDAARGGAQAAAGSARGDPPSSPGAGADEGGPAAPDGGGSPAPSPPEPSATTTDNDSDPSVNAIIDHMDRKLTD
jgi:hypothetical protein